MARKSITFADKQDEWLKKVVELGFYKDESDYVRDLVRKDQAQNEKFYALQAAIQKGLDSGVSERNLDDIWAQAQEEYKAKHG